MREESTSIYKNMLAFVFMRLAIICICLHLNFCLGRAAIKTEVTYYI